MTYSNFNEQPPEDFNNWRAGFIGGTLIRKLIANTNHEIINLDKLGYASDLSSINEYLEKSNNKHRYKFYKVDLTNKSVLEQIINCESPDLVFHLAAESHVDRSLLIHQIS